jgi:hypothetical protein
MMIRTGRIRMNFYNIFVCFLAFVDTDKIRMDFSALLTLTVGASDDD